jgi:hypothetical protein
MCCHLSPRLGVVMGEVCEMIGWVCALLHKTLLPSSESEFGDGGR